MNSFQGSVTVLTQSRAKLAPRLRVDPHCGRIPSKIRQDTQIAKIVQRQWLRHLALTSRSEPGRSRQKQDYTYLMNRITPPVGSG
ncbi:hypothetical protein GCM10022255_108940 [Dactylosporangium darangshiense]|uniref:Uncharacterized protein n=1 Tax=Dactylosporangium darangshiense TaxID=579108 RepID=A0ABP8DUQ5_9ACTN